MYMCRLVKISISICQARKRLTTLARSVKLVLQPRFVILDTSINSDIKRFAILVHKSVASRKQHWGSEAQGAKFGDKSDEA